MLQNNKSCSSLFVSSVHNVHLYLACQLLQPQMTITFKIKETHGFDNWSTNIMKTMLIGNFNRLESHERQS